MIWAHRSKQPTMDEALPIPESFKALRGMFPVGLERQLGYSGPARYIGFCWDADEDDSWYTDGRDAGTTGQWEEYISFVGKLGPYFKVNLGGTEEPATHLFIWDRAEHIGFLAEKDEAEQFLAGQWPKAP